ncbi:hypothetical protein Enr13x_74030 [Stieleria neptunia]|uniref:Uncharacterized protein n=1 Tax=Stieleria neptunia TaxID=2527979 RepID=A0A518I315_9BACT|nr:hypothetical protein Enr13x_74030 [Stieleria neptunia]
MVQWSESDLRQHLGEENYLDEGHANWLRNDQAICFAAMDGERLAGFALGDVPAEMNHDGYPVTIRNYLFSCRMILASFFMFLFCLPIAVSVYTLC